MKNLSERRREEISENLYKIQNVASDFRTVLKRDYRHFRTEMVEVAFYLQFCEEMMNLIHEISFIVNEGVSEMKEGGEQ